MVCLRAQRKRFYLFRQDSLPSLPLSVSVLGRQWESEASFNPGPAAAGTYMLGTDGLELLQALCRLHRVTSQCLVTLKSKTPSKDRHLCLEQMEPNAGVGWWT